MDKGPRGVRQFYVGSDPASQRRLIGAQLLLDFIPAPLIYQRCYIAQASARPQV